MRWHVHGERSVYSSPWMSLALTDVEIPGGERFEHHVMRMPCPAAGVVMHHEGRVLLLWRHRFITDSWGWEVPAGRVEADETPIEAAAREALEETGWQPGPLRPLATYNPHAGSSDATFHLFAADGAIHVGEPVDIGESERIEWLPVAEVRAAMTRGEIVDGLSLTALLWWLNFGG